MLKIDINELNKHINTLNCIAAEHEGMYDEEALYYLGGLLTSIAMAVKSDNLCVIQGTTVPEAVGKLLECLPKGRVDNDLKIPLIKGIRAATGCSLKEAREILDSHIEFEPIPGIVKRYPSEWEVIDNIKVLDPDGWRMDNRPWDVPITREEWDRRMLRSTIQRGVKND